LIGATVREYRELEAGDWTPSLDTYRRISELDGWPQTFVPPINTTCERLASGHDHT
jgi:hypothetical protein